MAIMRTAPCKASQAQCQKPTRQGGDKKQCLAFCLDLSDAKTSATLAGVPASPCHDIHGEVQLRTLCSLTLDEKDAPPILVSHVERYIGRAVIDNASHNGSSQRCSLAYPQADK